MYYISKIKPADSSYSLQTTPSESLLEFPEEFLSEFFKSDKESAGFVTIEHDGKKVTSCVWNENAYQEYLSNLPKPDAQEEKNKFYEKISLLKNEAIVAGFDSEVLNRGVLHYDLTEDEQKDLASKYVYVQNGAETVFWKDSSRSTEEEYSAEQFVSLFNSANLHSSSCKIKANWLVQLAYELIDEGKYKEASEVNWNTELTGIYKEGYDDQIQKEALKSKAKTNKQLESELQSLEQSNYLFQQVTLAYLEDA